MSAQPDFVAMFDDLFGSSDMGAPGDTPGSVLAGLSAADLSKHSGPRSRKLARGKSATTVELGQAAHDVLASSSYAMTLRQLYYALVSSGAIPKTEASYGKLKRVMRDLREDGRQHRQRHRPDRNSLEMRRPLSPSLARYSCDTSCEELIRRRLAEAP